MGKNSNGLNPKQERFCREYIIDLNGTQAAIRAGYSKKTANRIANQLLSKLDIQQRIKTLQGKVEKKLELNAELILKELIALATVDLREAYDASGYLKPLHEIPERVRRAMSSLEPTEFGKKAKFYDKTRALELLGKHLKLFTEKHEHEVGETLGALIAKSYDLEKKNDGT